MIKFFLNRSVLANLLTIFIVVVGGYHFVNVRREAFPEIDFDFVTVLTPYPGASPEEVERLVTRRIEEQLRTVSDIEEVTSTSIEGQSFIFMKLNDDLSDRDSDKVVRNIEQAVSRVRGLPAEAEKPIIDEMTSDRPLITLSVLGGTDEDRHAFADDMADMLENIEGVAKVERQGYRKKEVMIEADREKLTRYRITLAEIAAAVRNRNLDVSAGTVEIGAEEVWVRAMGTVYTAEEVGGIIVRGNDERSFVRIKDLARVYERFEEERVISRANGRPSINLNVRKVKTGDTIVLADKVKKIQEDMGPRAKKLDIELATSDDISFFIKRRLKVMTNNMGLGGCLILLSLFCFLDWRLALVAAAGVPISLAAAFVLAVPMGFTINLLSLFAFIIVLGMLTDDAVVVAENIYRHLEMGKKPMQAAVDGAREVVAPVLASVSTTCCAFLPFAMMSGIMGKFLFIFPVIVILSFIASAFEAFCILPSHVVDLMPFGAPVEKTKNRGWFTKVQGWYRRALSWSLNHHWKFLLGLFVFLLLTGFVAKWRLKVVMFPPGLIDQFFIQVEMPQGTGLPKTEEVLKKVEEIVLKLPSDELDEVTANVGLKGFEESLRMGTHYAQVRVFLTPEEHRERKTKVIVEELRKKVNALPDAEKIAFQELHPGPPVGMAVQMRVCGRDLDTIGTIVDEVKQELHTMSGVVDIEDSREGGKDQLQVVLNDKEAAYAGLDVSKVAQNIFFAVDGGEASEIRRESERDEVKIKVRLEEEQRNSPKELLALEVLNNRGRPVRLGTVASIQKVKGPSFLQRYNFKPVVTVTADVELDKITSREANAYLREMVAEDMTLSQWKKNRVADYMSLLMKKLKESDEIKKAKVVRENEFSLVERCAQTGRIFLGMPSSGDIVKAILFKIKLLKMAHQEVIVDESYKARQVRLFLEFLKIVKKSGSPEETFKSIRAQSFVSIPSGYEIIFGGEEKDTQESMQSLGRAFGVAVFLDLVILASVFGSYMQPFIILLTIPIGLLGVVYALILHGKPASFMALLGIVALAGVVVNNAIVLVDFINKKRAEGLNAVQAAVEAGVVRMRPIMASSITTLVALFPTVYGIIGYEPFIAPMALSLAWGLAMAMPLTLFLIPMAYVMSEEMNVFVSQKIQKIKDKLFNHRETQG